MGPWAALDALDGEPSVAPGLCSRCHAGSFASLPPRRKAAAIFTWLWCRSKRAAPPNTWIISGRAAADGPSRNLRRARSATDVRLFPNGGSWSFFLCPACLRRVRSLRLWDGRIVCRWCDGLAYRRKAQRDVPEGHAGTIARLEQKLFGGPARLNPRKGRTLDRRKRLELSLRCALMIVRRLRLEG